MTSYHGGKQRIGAQIAEIIGMIASYLETEKEQEFIGYCEPFCGMLGVYKHIPDYLGDDCLYFAGDTNKNVIAMWKQAQKGWKPPSFVSESQYNTLKKGKVSALAGYAGHQYSYMGETFMGYAPKYGKNPDSSKASKNVVEIAKKLKQAKFSAGSYKQYGRLKGFIIYCDPPYESTSIRYKDKDSFCISDFYDWCRCMSQENLVIVSGYTAPSDFTEIWSSSHKLTGNLTLTSKNKKRVEKLYIVY